MYNLFGLFRSPSQLTEYLKGIQDIFGYKKADILAKFSITSSNFQSVMVLDLVILQNKLIPGVSRVDWKCRNFNSRFG